ncbi:hypothetical protein AX17_004564 [Amanita inopinata Kibby_2008]|nr:hypothetical protein AX17_004564 [Amanita inopinata Kibby_2008]
MSNAGLHESLPTIVPRLLTRFSSKEGYKAFDDAIPALNYLHDRLGVFTAVISNADSRIRSVIEDLDFPASLDPIILSEEEGVEKPGREIFDRGIQAVSKQHLQSQQPLQPSECLHVGDELVCDYEGAKRAGMQALLLRRPGSEGDQAHKDENESLQGVGVVRGLDEVIWRVRECNRTS